MRMVNVLLVDDEDVFNFLNKKMLQRVESIKHIKAVLSGRQALELLTTSNSEFLPDLILLDIDMPIMNGFEFLESFNKLKMPERNAIKIAILSSSHTPADMELAKNLGVSHYLTKPLTEKDIRLILA